MSVSVIHVDEQHKDSHRLSVGLLPSHLPVQMELSRASSGRAASETFRECQVRYSPPCLSPSHYVVVELRGLVDVSVLRSLWDEDWLVRLGHQPASYN